MVFKHLAAGLAILASRAAAANFTIANGQVFTPGFAVLDAPQPGTPLGGDIIEVALDVSANGRLNLPPYADDSPSKIFNITIFLYSYTTGRNFTITNGTASAGNATLGDVMLSEPGSTVKHVKWRWPACLVGDGRPTTQDSDRGSYNISIRQNFRLNKEDHYTIFDVPISVTNKIDDSVARASCDAVNNPLLQPDEVNVTAANAEMGTLFAPGDSTQVQVTSDSNGLGGTGRPEAVPGDGLGGAVTLTWSGAASWLALLSTAAIFFL